MNETISKYIKNGLFILFVLILGTYILLELFSPEKTIEVLGYKHYVVISSSMEPDIMINDMIIVHKVDEDKLEVRDVITFDVFIPELGSNSRVTHYIGDIQVIGSDTIYKTQGATKDPGDYDVWKNADNDIIEITYDDIDGRVVLVIPYLGYAVKILQDPVSVGLLSVNVLIIYFLVKTIKKLKEEKEIVE